MVQKRCLDDEESYEGSFKHPRPLDYTSQLVSFLQFVHAEKTSQPPDFSGEVGGSFKEGNEKHAGGITSELPILFGKDSTREEENRAEAPFLLLLTPEHYNADRPIRRTLVHSEETHGSLLEFPPQKLVPIGPAFQADIPECGTQGAKNTSNSSGGSELTSVPQALELNLSDNKDVEVNLGGICVIPMLESGLFANNDEKVGKGRTDCNCEDFGSVRCIRQHIKETRENLRSALGEEAFLELGFSDMGEVVTEQWSQEEEELFREVVFSNPASSGNNFWDHLSLVLPLRTKRDIVSYYFNVFVLQTRAVQNRYDSMNIDSDDDEWRGIVDSGDDEGGSDEEDGESVLGYKACCGVPYTPNELLDDDLGEYDGSVQCEGFGDCENVKFGSYEATINNNSKGHLGSFVGMSGGDSHEYVLEHCETKVWDVGCSTWPKNEVELLPTCSMIEEVFGIGPLNYMAGDGKGLR